VLELPQSLLTDLERVAAVRGVRIRVNTIE
jgi:hypothetical protein